MSKRKWEVFRSMHSPVNVTDFSQQTNNIIADWNRVSEKKNEETITINGVPLHELWTRKFQTEQDVKSFFEDVILHQLNDKDKIIASDYLYRIFHQGGLLYPVSSTLQFAVKDDYQNVLIGLPANGGDLSRKINIITTEHGFKLQEIYQAKVINANPPTKVPGAYDVIYKKEIVPNTICICVQDTKLGCSIVNQRGEEGLFHAFTEEDFKFLKLTLTQRPTNNDCSSISDGDFKLNLNVDTVNKWAVEKKLIPPIDWNYETELQKIAKATSSSCES